MAKRKGLFINTKLSAEQTLVLLACLDVQQSVSDPAFEQVRHDLFVDLSKSAERRWPEMYHIALTGGLKHWRAARIDKMSEPERRDALLRIAR